MSAALESVTDTLKSYASVENLKSYASVEVIKEHTIDKVWSEFYLPVDPPLQPWKKAVLPLYGIYYFLTTPAMWLIILCPIICTAITAILALGLIFGLALFPQELFFRDVCGFPTWASWLTAVVFCLGEVLFCILLVVGFFMEGTRRRIYRKVFQLHDCKIKYADEVLANRSVLQQMSDGCCAECAGGCCFICQDIAATFSDCCCLVCHPQQLLRCLFQRFVSWVLFLVTMPLNAIPIVGTVVFCLINGTWMAWRMQSSYLIKKGLNRKERRYFFKHRLPEFVAFGMVCTFLDMIPLLDIILIYTNVVASALWAVEMEKSGMLNIIHRPPPKVRHTEEDALLVVDDTQHHHHHHDSEDKGHSNSNDGDSTHNNYQYNVYEPDSLVGNKPDYSPSVFDPQVAIQDVNSSNNNNNSEWIQQHQQANPAHVVVMDAYNAPLQPPVYNIYSPAGGNGSNAAVVSNAQPAAPTPVNIYYPSSSSNTINVSVYDVEKKNY